MSLKDARWKWLKISRIQLKWFKIAQTYSARRPDHVISNKVPRTNVLWGVSWTAALKYTLQSGVSFLLPSAPGGRWLLRGRPPRPARIRTAVRVPRWGLVVECCSCYARQKVQFAIPSTCCRWRNLLKLSIACLFVFTNAKDLRSTVHRMQGFSIKLELNIIKIHDWCQMTIN